MAISRVRGKGQPKREIDEVLKLIARKKGDSYVKTGSEILQPYRIPTGIFSLDMALCGGIFVGKQNMFLGMRSSGKTTAAFKTIANAQRMFPNQQAVLVQPEDTYDPVWAEKLGVNVDDLLVITPETGEEAVDMIQGVMNAEDISLMVLDSVGALIPMKERDSSAEDAHVGIHAKLVTTMVRRVSSALTRAAQRNHNLTALYINQYRAGIGKWAPPGQEATSIPGGKALDHFTALQVVFKNKESLKKDDEGFEQLAFNEHSFKIEKNKFNAGIRKGEFLLMRAEGDYGLVEGNIDDAAAMLATAKRMEIYTGAGRSWTLTLPDPEDPDSGLEYNFGSADEAITALYGDPEFHRQTRNHIIAMHSAKLGMPQYVLDRIYASGTEVEEEEEVDE